MNIVIISDTHCMHNDLLIPDGDVLIHAGDFTECGTMEEVKEFNEFLSTLPHKYKIVIAGNHEFCFERDPRRSQSALTNCTYLCDSAVQIESIKFYGSPWQPWFFDFAFNLQRGQEIREKWQQIDKDTDVLITHGPPFGYCDKVGSGENVGCEELIKIVEKIKPKLHIFGHIHESYGVSRNENTIFINGSNCNYNNFPVNEPIIVQI